MSQNDNPPSNPLSIPNDMILFTVLNQFLIRWANLSAQFVNMPMEDLSPLQLEQGIFFYEPFVGIFVMRSTKDFEKFLVKLSTGKKPGRNYEEKGIFLEMAVLFWHLLVSQVWRLDSRTLKPAKLKTSVPVDWPDRKPDSSCTVFIKDFPLEIRIWSHLSPEEVKRWESPRTP